MSTLRDAITNAIKSHSSPTIGRGIPHDGQAGYIVYEHDGLPFVVAAIERAIESDNARLTRENAAMREALVEAEEDLRPVERPASRDPQHHARIAALGNEIGFGALMSGASAAWREVLQAKSGRASGGEFVAGPCFSTVASCLKKIRTALAELDAAPVEEASPVAIDYTNWRGDRRTRNIIPLRTFHGSNEWHKEPQWLLEAVDQEDGKTKTFAFAGIHGFGEPYQARVHDWILACFGAEIGADKIERNHRLLEEALEAVQAGGCTRSEAHQLVDYVFDRPVGDLWQEVGGVMNTLAAFCTAHGLDMAECGERELARVWTKVEAIRAKQAAKPKHSPLPMVTPERPAESSALAAARKTTSSMREALDAAESILRYTPSISTNCNGTKPGMTTQRALQLVRDALGAHGTMSEP